MDHYPPNRSKESESVHSKITSEHEEKEENVEYECGKIE